MKKLLILFLLFSSFAIGQTRMIPLHQLVTDYTNATEATFAGTLTGYPNGGVIIYNTDLAKIRIWNGTAFADSPTIPLNNIPAMTAPSLGAATATSINGNIFTSGSSTYTGTAGQTYTFPTTTATIARTDAANTFTGIQTMTSPAQTTSVTTATVSFTAWAGATTLLTIGGTGASASMFAPSTLDATTSITGAIRTSGGISAAKALFVGTNISAAGSIKSTGTLGIGYAAGSGGTVTQGSSRTTGVTLSKTTGNIITNTTSLAASTAATFTVTNTLVAIDDIIAVSIRSGATNVKTFVNVTAVAAGSFNITIVNSDASTAEVGAIIINFAVIKGSPN